MEKDSGKMSGRGKDKGKGNGDTAPRPAPAMPAYKPVPRFGGCPGC